MLLLNKATSFQTKKPYIMNFISFPSSQSRCSDHLSVIF